MTREQSGAGDERVNREVKLDPDIARLAQLAGVSEESAAIVEAEVRSGDLIVTVSGERDILATDHRLPDELTTSPDPTKQEDFDT